MIDLKQYTQLKREDFRNQSSYAYYEGLVAGVYFYLGNLWLIGLTESPKLEEFSKTALLNTFVAFSDDPQGARGIGVHSGTLKEVVGPHLSYSTPFFLLHNIAIIEQYLKAHFPRPDHEKKTILPVTKTYKDTEDTNFVDYFYYDLIQKNNDKLSDNLHLALKNLSNSADLRHRFVHDRFNKQIKIDMNHAIESWINSIAAVNDLDKIF